LHQLENVLYKWSRSPPKTQLAVAIYMLLWCEYNSRHALELCIKSPSVINHFLMTHLFSLFPRSLNFFINFRVALWLLYSSYSNIVMMETKNSLCFSIYYAHSQETVL